SFPSHDAKVDGSLSGGSLREEDLARGEIAPVDEKDARDVNPERPTAFGANEQHRASEDERPDELNGALEEIVERAGQDPTTDSGDREIQRDIVESEDDAFVGRTRRRGRSDFRLAASFH